jgi:hypothetical protein
MSCVPASILMGGACVVERKNAPDRNGYELLIVQFGEAREDGRIDGDD